VVFEVKYFEYTLFVYILPRHDLRRRPIANYMGPENLGCPSSAARPPFQFPSACLDLNSLGELCAVEEFDRQEREEIREVRNAHPFEPGRRLRRHSNLGLLIPHFSRTIAMYVVRIGREQFLPQQPVTSRSTSESLQRKLNNQRNT
jgi:hypothetical protein